MDVYLAFTDIDGKIVGINMSQVTKFKPYVAPLNPKAPTSKWNGFSGTKIHQTDASEQIVRETPEEIFEFLAEMFAGSGDDDDEYEDDDDNAEEHSESSEESGIPENDGTVTDDEDDADV